MESKTNELILTTVLNKVWDADDTSLLVLRRHPQNLNKVTLYLKEKNGMVGLLAHDEVYGVFTYPPTLVYCLGSQVIFSMKIDEVLLAKAMSEAADLLRTYPLEILNQTWK